MTPQTPANKSGEAFGVIREVLRLSKGMTRAIYRGQRDAVWDPESGASRRLILTDPSDMLKELKKYQTALLAQLDLIHSNNQSNEENLAALQHHGAATMLLDFSHSPLVALWFACSDEEKSKDGKVFAVDIGPGWTNARNIKGWLSKSPEENLYYEPDQVLSPRIAAQQSVFVVCNPEFPGVKIRDVTVPWGSKRDILQHLHTMGVSEATLFADLPGLAIQNTVDRPYRPEKRRALEDLKADGLRAFHQGKHEKALEFFSAVRDARPDVAEPHWLMGNAHAVAGDQDKAIPCYTQAIERKDRVIDFHLATYHYNRGNAHAVADDQDKAIADYDKVLNILEQMTGQLDGNHQHARTLARHARFNRANSHYRKQDFAAAFDDFKHCNENWGNRSDTHLGMGNALLMQGRLRKAAGSYAEGQGLKPDTQSVHCKTNLESVMPILVDLPDDDAEQDASQLDGRSHVVTDPDTDAELLVIKGNRGNFGNWGWGKGYDGLPDFAVRLEAPQDPSKKDTQ